ncbi:hypothetical protein SNE40_014020 [Patella caerulea]|uniref:SHSP domain-containing protein n=1 Tax=Patella caerulea TaxID=87958 RepID=A0AAN8PRX0_PATCE
MAGRALIPFLAEDLYFDDIFDEINRDAMRMQHDMRNAMMRLAPRDPISARPIGSLQQQLAHLRQPVNTKPDGSKALDLKLDVSNYKPEEIDIRTVGRDVCVHAKHEEKTDNSSVYQEFTRKFTLPEGVDPNAVTSSLSKDGILSISGPVAGALEDAPRNIPIEKK